MNRFEQYMKNASRFMNETDEDAKLEESKPDLISKESAECMVRNLAYKLEEGKNLGAIHVKITNNRVEIQKYVPSKRRKAPNHGLGKAVTVYRFKCLTIYRFFSTWYSRADIEKHLAAYDPIKCYEKVKALREQEGPALYGLKWE